jgi:hypothetical protein
MRVTLSFAFPFELRKYIYDGRGMNVNEWGNKNCVCVCVRERERERERDGLETFSNGYAVFLQKAHLSWVPLNMEESLLGAFVCMIVKTCIKLQQTN